MVARGTNLAHRQQCLDGCIRRSSNCEAHVREWYSGRFLRLFLLPSSGISERKSYAASNEARIAHSVSAQDPVMGAYYREHQQLAEQISRMLEPVREVCEGMESQEVAMPRIVHRCYLLHRYLQTQLSAHLRVLLQCYGLCHGA